MNNEHLEYVGFWPRVGASLIDTILLGMISWPILSAVYGESYWTSEKIIMGATDFLMSWAFPALAIIIFWIVKQTSPGKLVFSAKLVDASTGLAPSPAQCVARYLAYFPAMLPFCLGLIWITFDDRKQGWHDKLAGTVVVRAKKQKTKPLVSGHG